MNRYITPLLILFLFPLLMPMPVGSAELERLSGWRQVPQDLAQTDMKGYELRGGAEVESTSLTLSAKTNSCSLNDCPWDYSLEVELRPAVESFTGNPTHSSPVISRDNRNCREIEYGQINVGGLINGTAYKWQAREKVVTYNVSGEGGAMTCQSPKTFYSDWQVHGDREAPSFTVFPVSIKTVKSPIAVYKLKGSGSDGIANRLNMDDERYYRVWATAQSPYTASWYALFNGIEKGARNLVISYKGYNSQSCYQNLQIWDWALEEWIDLDSREAGDEEILMDDLVPPGDLSSYVSSTGRGEVRIRVSCSSDLLSFSSNGNSLTLSYDKPLGKP